MKAIALLLLLSCVVADPTPTPAPRITIDLDQPPQERWKKVMVPYLPLVPGLVSYFRHMVPGDLWKVAQFVAADLENLIPTEYAQEINGLAEVVIARWPNVTKSDIVLMNIVYDLTAGSLVSLSKHGFACTSIVAELPSGHIIHGRNLDYSGASYLRNLTVQVAFQKAGQTVYTGTTYMGYVGLLTAQKPNGFTISVDERDKGTQIENLLDILVENKGINFVANMVRTTVASSMKFDDAVRYLANSKIIAPVYIIVGGTDVGQGVILTRGRLEHTLDWWFINQHSGRWYVLETNYDHWVPPPKNDDRRDPANKAMRKIGQAAISTTGVFSVLSTPPVLNAHTTYTTIMSAHDPSVYHTEVRHVQK